MTFTIIFISAIIVVIAYVIGGYNRAVNLRNYVREAFSTMDVYLKKRWDLIPNLVETVKGYASHEKGLLTELTEARSKSYGSMSETEKLQANMKLGALAPKIQAVAENYPDLKANESFNKMMDNLAGIEYDIVNARKYYNGTVREYNTYTEVFPSNIICALFGFREERLFEIADGERQNVQIKF